METLQDNKMKKLPNWISEYIPSELVESALFRFNIELQSVSHFKCSKCGYIYDNNIRTCNRDVDGAICDGALERHYRQITVDILPDIDLDYNILEDQFQSLPAQYVFYSMLYSEARLKVGIEERRLKAVKGRILERMKEEANRSGVKLTAEQLKTIMEADPQIIKADHKLLVAQMQCGKLFHIVEALKMKAELARSLAGFKKNELKET